MGKGADPHTMLWRGSKKETELLERRRQQHADAFKAVFLERWQDHGILRALGSCVCCQQGSKKCTHELPACAPCVRRGQGHSCTYRVDKRSGSIKVPSGFDVDLAKRRIQSRHARIVTGNEITMEEAQELPISNIGTPGGFGCCFPFTMRSQCVQCVDNMLKFERSDQY